MRIERLIRSTGKDGILRHPGSADRIREPAEELFAELICLFQGTVSRPLIDHNLIGCRLSGGCACGGRCTHRDRGCHNGRLPCRNLIVINGKVTVNRIKGYIMISDRFLTHVQRKIVIRHKVRAAVCADAALRFGVEE